MAVKVLTRTKETTWISITNPTGYDANVSVFAEALAGVKKPLGNSAILQCPKAKVNVGAMQVFEIGKDGKIYSR